MESTEPERAASPEEVAADTPVEREFGSYTVPKGWVESEQFTTEQKIFYLAEGKEQEEPPDNISVEAGDIVYQFTITPEDGDVATTQYYIIGDHQFVLVHETAKMDSDADAAAKSIVDSFIWKR